MSEPVELSPEEPTITGIQGQVSAIRQAVAAIIAAMPEDQRSKILATLTGQAQAADTLNAEFAASTVGETAAHHMQLTFRAILDAVPAFQALLRQPK